jgi:E3 ubiquitin-protein ligase HUWE1
LAPNIAATPRSLEMCRFVGRLIGAALVNQFRIPAFLSLFVWKQILGRGAHVSDLWDVKPDVAQNLKTLAESQGVEDLGFVFAVSVEDADGIRDVDLIADGRNIRVTSEVVGDYIALVAYDHLLGHHRDHLMAIVGGVHDVVPPSVLSAGGLTPSELEELVCGKREIDVDDWERNTQYSGYTATHQVIRWFWAAVREMTAEERSQLLMFVTGSRNLPSGGFRSLVNGHRNYCLFTIGEGSYNPERLPQAHTCFNKLDLPRYTSQAQLKQKVLAAATCGSVGYEFS